MVAKLKSKDGNRWCACGKRGKGVRGPAGSGAHLRFEAGD